MSFMREPNAEPIPGYRLIEPLGSGGYGEVWKCEAPGGLFKAIKFVFGNLNSLDVDGARAEQELKALSRVKEVRHPFVLSMERIEVVEGELVIVMELADRNLHDAFEECLTAGLVGIPRDTLLGYVRDAAEALDHMNEQHNLQHLDIKPRNLFLVSNRVKVADFGLVKHLDRSGTSGVLGGVTPLYAPPETFSGNISGRSDQYSLAIVYQELLTGQRPFAGKNARALAQQHLHADPELRALPEGERPVVARALAKDPDKRFPNCLALVRALYNARSPVRPEALLPDGASGPRPKTMVDTLENISLEQHGDDDRPVAVDPEAEGLAGHALEEVSNLGLTVARAQTGALRPTVVIGLGSFGRRALLELRCRFLDRFGDLDKVPLIRFLYLDTDAGAVKAASRGAAEVAFRPGEVYHLPLQPVSHYRRRHLDQLNEWLPREKLYAMPRALKTQGSRALGRLAFTDNYLRVMARLRREIQQACHPDTIYHTVSRTGLALRDGVPRVYVIASAGGGSSGFLADLGYSLRRLAQQLRQPDAPVVSLLFCGAPGDPATPAAEQANLYATLTELNHFGDPAVPFAAQYGTDGPRLVDEGPAFDDTYLLAQANRTPQERRDVMAHLGSYLFHEMTTPLGLRLDRSRQRHSPATPFRSFGTYGVWFPRGLLLRLAARGACLRVLEEWGAAADAPTAWLPAPADALLEAAQARVLHDPELAPEALQTRIAELASAALEGGPREALTRLLAGLEEQSQQFLAQDDPEGWARQALQRVQDWLGSGVQPSGGASAVGQRKSRLTKALEGAASRLAEEWHQRLGEATRGLLEHPGRRLLLAETFVTGALRFCEEATAGCEARREQQAQRTRHARDLLQTALENCISGVGGFSWFGGRARRLQRVFMDHLAAFARQCLADDLLAAVAQFFIYLRGRLADHLRDLTFCRQRLRHIQETLSGGGPDHDDDDESSDCGSRTADCGLQERGPSSSIRNPRPAIRNGADTSPTPPPTAESFWETIRESATTRVVLPDGEADLEHAARTFLKTLTAEQWTQLDQAFQDQVLSLRGGLERACLDTSDLIRHLAAPLLNQAVSILGEHLPITDVAQVEFSLPASGRQAEGGLAARMQTYFTHAAPLLTRQEAARSRSGEVAPLSVGGAGAAALQQDRRDQPGGAQTPPPPPAAANPLPPDDCFLLIPASEAGKRFGEEAEQVLAGVRLVNVPGQADLLFCREQNGLSLEDLERLLQSCRTAYRQVAVVPNTSPHARFDIQDWTPLDP